MGDASQPLRDWGKAIASLDLTKGVEELLKVLAQLKVPGVDMDALVASQRDNLEALSASNRAAIEGMKAVAEWQKKVLQETITAITGAVGALAKSGSPQEMVVEQTELANKAFEVAVRQMRELSEIVTKANKEATEAIVKRIPESLDEIKDVLKMDSALSGSRKA
jgi:phasin family protein